MVCRILSVSNLLQAISTMPQRQRAVVQRLVEHCRGLDGTELKVVEITQAEDDAFKPKYPRNAFWCVQGYGFHLGALAATGKPFLWVEPDSIPLKPDWIKTITAEYNRLGKAILLPDMTGLSRFDIASGIGVYPGITHQIVPFQFKRAGFDKWIVDHMASSIARTRLIQHSYGIYGEDRYDCEPHRFPRDSAIIRPESVLFHRDKFQDLITGAGPKKWDFAPSEESKSSVDL